MRKGGRKVLTPLHYPLLPWRPLRDKQKNFIIASIPLTTFFYYIKSNYDRNCHYLLLWLHKQLWYFPVSPKLTPQLLILNLGKLNYMQTWVWNWCKTKNNSSNSTFISCFCFTLPTFRIVFLNSIRVRPSGLTSSF